MSLTMNVHECPKCGGSIERKNFAERRFVDRVDKFLRCEFCGYGIECSQYHSGELYALDFQERTEPVSYGKFLQRLESARVA